jgi:hypothetical protein
MTQQNMSLNYTMNKSSRNIHMYNKSANAGFAMPFSSINGKMKTIVGLEIKPSSAYKGCGSCGRG